MRTSRTPFWTHFRNGWFALALGPLVLMACSSAEHSPDADIKADVSSDISTDISDVSTADISPDVQTDVEDTLLPTEDICTPDCGDRVCGNNGCGGLCGECGEEEECVDGQCKTPCISDEECTETGLIQCNEEGDSERTCEEVDVGCFQWSNPIACPEGWTCIDNACIDPCLPQCPLDWCGDDGCGGSCAPCLSNDKVCVNNVCEPDADSDGYPISQDCDDSHPGVNPGEEESLYDGLDNDCDPATPDDDADGDGAVCICMGGDDCDDDNASLFPGSADWVGDGIDHNCDGHDGIDADQDFYGSIVSGGLDCDDSDPAIHPTAEDLEGDGIDVNCDGVDGYPPPGPLDNKLCFLSGNLGDTIDCPLLLVGEESGLPNPTGLQVNLQYNPESLSLINFFDEICNETNDCTEVPLVNPGNEQNQTGHTFATYPFGTAESPWAGTVSLLVLHLTQPQTILSSAYLTFDKQIVGDATIGVARFLLLTDLDAEAPAAVEGTNVLGVSTEMLPLEGGVHDERIILEAP